MTTHEMEEATLASILTTVSPGVWAASSDHQVSHGPEQTSPCSEDQSGSQEYKQFFQTVQVLCGLVFYPLFCAVGITGNVFSLAVFTHRDMQNSVYVYLAALAVSDLIKLTNDAGYILLVAMIVFDPARGERWIAFMYPLAHYIIHVSVCVTAWLTVSAAIVRYLHVCHPSRERIYCSISRAWIICICIFVLMSFLAMPSALRYAAQTHYDHVLNQTCTRVVLTELGSNEVLMVPYNWILNSLRSFIPVFILAFLSARIIMKIRREPIVWHEKNSTTLMLILVVVMFMVCVTPDALMSTFLGLDYKAETFLVEGIREITDLLLTTNSAMNFFLYLSISKQFRNTFLKIFCGGSREETQGDERTSTARISGPVQDKASSGVRDDDGKTSPSASPVLILN